MNASKIHTVTEVLILEEQHDLAAEQPERAAAMQARLAAWRDEVDAALPARADTR